MEIKVNKAIQDKCLCYPEDKCKAPPELDPMNFLCACSCGAKLCSICVGDAGFENKSGVKCRLCKENYQQQEDVVNSKSTSFGSKCPTTAVDTPCRIFFEICQSCNIKKFDPDDDYGRHYGECRSCVQKRKGRHDLMIVRQPLIARDFSTKCNRSQPAKRLPSSAKFVALPMDDNMLDSDLLLSQSSAGQEEDKARATLVDQQSASAIATSLENKSILANDSPAVALNDSSAVACLVNAGVMIDIDKENENLFFDEGDDHEVVPANNNENNLLEPRLVFSNTLEPPPLETQQVEAVETSVGYEALNTLEGLHDVIQGESLETPLAGPIMSSTDNLEAPEDASSGDDAAEGISEEEIEIIAALRVKNHDFIVAFKSLQETVTVPTPGGGDAKLLFTVIPKSKFTKVKGKNYGKRHGNNRSVVPRHYYCKEFFGDQNIQRYISIEFHAYVSEFHAYVVNRCRRTHDTLVIGLCGLRCTLDQEEELKYVLCSSYFGNCGKLRHYIYLIESGTIEVWGSLIRTERGEKKKYYCDTTMPFPLQKVLKVYLNDRADDHLNPVFDPQRYDKRYGKGKSANYVVPKVVFGDIDFDNPPIPAIMASNNPARLTRSAVSLAPTNCTRGSRRNPVLKGGTKSGKETASTRARSRQSKVESSQIDAREFASTSLRESSKRSNRNREEERLHSANSSSANSRLFSKKVGDSTSFPVTIDENEVYPMEYEQPVVHSHHRAIATRVSKPIAALESDDEEPVVEVMPVKRGKASVSCALKELGQELEFHNKIVEQQYRTFNAIGGFSGKNCNNQLEDNQYRDMWVSLMLKQQDNIQKQAEGQVQFLQQLILGQCQTQKPVVSDHVQQNAAASFYLPTQVPAPTFVIQPQVAQNPNPVSNCYYNSQPQLTQPMVQFGGLQLAQQLHPPMQVVQHAQVSQPAPPIQVAQQPAPHPSMQIMQPGTTMQIVQPATHMQVVSSLPNGQQIMQLTPSNQLVSTSTNQQAYYLSPMVTPNNAVIYQQQPN